MVFLDLIMTWLVTERKIKVKALNEWRGIKFLLKLNPPLCSMIHGPEDMPGAYSIWLLA